MGARVTVKPGPYQPLPGWLMTLKDITSDRINILLYTKNVHKEHLY